ncbi:MAG: hypothetical protein NT120_03795 [Candidatus Aenigmarchaeota archaeon]|nr:hypothetical protein [Candidatus Aenigmarchaeota archaeon]
MMGATIGFAALDAYPAPFVTSSGVQSLIVVGSQGTDPVGLAQDVSGAINIAARLGGAVTTTVAVPGAVATGSVVGEGKLVATRTTNIFLNDTLGKTGLKSTLTKDDLPTLLAKGSLSDSVGTHKYDQYIDLTPGTTNPANFNLAFDRPGSSSTTDPAYNFGRFSTSPTASEYMYRTRIVFDVGIDGNATSKSLKLFGNDYTISADSTGWFADSTADKLVLFGGANINTLHGGESVDVTIGSSSYHVTLAGVTSGGSAVVH